MLSRPGLDDAWQGLRFAVRLQAFLRRPLTAGEARATVGARLATREARFLGVLRGAVYGQATSPYLPLLRHAGCEYGDVERLVAAEGVEGALGRLLAEGVYLSVDELKGRTPVRRGATTLAVDPARLWNPGTTAHVGVRSSGSRGVGTVVPMGLPCIREHAAAQALVVEARGLAGRRAATWAVPGGAAVLQLLRYAMAGFPLDRWFSPVALATPGLPPRYRWSVLALRAGALGAGVRVPRPEAAPLDDPLPVLRWLAGAAQRTAGAYLRCSPSAAVRLSLAARAAGVDLSHVAMTAGGEPLTATRLATIARAGAMVVPAYSSIETAGPLAHGCLAPAAPDDVHLLHDLHAVVRSERGARGARGVSDGGLLVSSLADSAPLVLLNVSLGDRAEIVERRCGCPLEAAGWRTHLHTIRSDEKLTAAGMTFSDADLVRILDEVLPARFGGGPTDYQLVEDESPEGEPVLRLLVRPGVGPVDPDGVARAFLDALAQGPDAARVMSLAWRRAGIVRVERRAPEPTRSGKILHLRDARPREAGGRRAVAGPHL